MQRRSKKSCLLSFTAGMTLALCGLVGVVSLCAMTGEAQAAGRSVVQQGFAQAPAAFSAIRVNRGSSEKRCPRSTDNACAKDQFPLPLPPPPQ